MPVKKIPADISKPMIDMGEEEPDLQTMKSAVGGHIEHVNLRRYNKHGFPVDKPRCLIVNEEGKLQGLPINYRATQIFRDRYPQVPDVIVGDVLYFDGVELS